MAKNSGKPKQKTNLSKHTSGKKGTVKPFKGKKLSRGEAIALQMGSSC